MTEESNRGKIFLHVLDTVAQRTTINITRVRCRQLESCVAFRKLC